MVVVQVDMMVPTARGGGGPKIGRVYKLRLFYDSSRGQQNLYMLTRHEEVVCRENERCRVGRKANPRSRKS